MWMDKLMNREFRSYFCLGQSGYQGWTGVAFLTEDWLLCAITPMGVISENALEIYKEPDQLLGAFVRRHFEIK